MTKKVLAAGVAGWIALMLWTFVSNAVFGLRSRTDLRRIPDETRVYEVLKAAIAEPGGYMCNPPPAPDGRFPPDQPVFGIRTSGSGHEIAGRLMIVHLASSLVATLIVSWMLSTTVVRVRSGYFSKVLFCAAVGLLFAVFGDLPSYGIGGRTLRDALLLGGQNLAAWSLAGLAIAPFLRPDRTPVGVDA